MNAGFAMTDWEWSVSPASGSAGAQCRQPAARQEAHSVTNITYFVPFGPRLLMQVEIGAEARLYRLHGPLAINIDYLEDSTIFVAHATFPVHGYGRSYDDAIQAFCEMFDSQYRNLVECDESEITNGAKKQREQLLGAVHAIEER